MGQNGDNQLNDLSHERAVWKVEHWGWGAFALILLAALVGVFGEGPVARAKAENSRLSVEYDRFVRYQAPTKLRIHLASGGSSMPALSIGQDFLERVEVEHVTPEPERVKVGQGTLIYIFDVAHTNQKATVTFEFKPAAYGNTAVKLGLVGGPQLQFTQFFYP